MKYNFDEVIDRSGNRAAKYDERRKNFGTDDVIPLWIADMDFRTAQPIIDACKAKAEEGIWGYTSRPDSYFEAYASWQKRRNGWSIDTSLCSWSLGVVPALAALIKLFTGPNDKVLIQPPVYPEFYEVTEMVGRRVAENNMVQTENGWEVDFEDFERKAKDPLVKMFILCSPHNPLGKVWAREELERMLDICFANGVLVVSDEIHSDLIFHGKKHIPTAMVSEEAKSRVISCISGTKTFNLAGLQASTTVFPNMELKQIFDHYWSAMDIHRNNAFSSVAMEAAFNEGEEWLEQVLEYISGNFDYIQDYCAKYIPEIKPSVPDATYLVWLDCRALGMDDETLKEFMIRKAKLGMNPGSSFTRSLTGFMRLNAACPRPVIKKAMEQLRDAVSDLRGSKPCMS
ncbi:MalY/PatB family protein [Evtepia sp.]|uniref:MalY/PatB family protein n=1 Tax=Evtepia sp. TaxID=2773933 RepID=UPI002E7867F8|nr:PatB family C-S lyase [Evtepia sp.]MEE0257545.1 PatB family C-S lyase [Evtepia sp.]